MTPVIAETRAKLDALCEQFRVRRLEVFGSSATDDRFDPQRSDLDFIVEFQPDQEMGPWLRHYFAFQRALAELYRRPVDLVMASAMANVHFVQEAAKTRRLLYGV